MAQVATLTIGSDTFSVYGITSDPLADANSYIAGKFSNAAWTALTDDQKKQAIVSANRSIDSRPIWSGEQVSSSQTNAWPRNSATCNGTAVPDGTTPDNVAHAQFELAFLIVSDPELPNTAGTGTNIKRAKAGTAEVEFFTPTVGTGQATLFPTVVHELIGCYYSANSTTAPTVTGKFSSSKSYTGSSFTEEHGLSEGYP